MSYKMAWLVLVLCISTSHQTLAQQWTHVRCALGNIYPSYKDSHLAINAIFISESPSGLEPASDYDSIEYIFYSGNDWDYDTHTLPNSWFHLKNLKGIILNNMTYEAEAIEDARKHQPNLFLENSSVCHARESKIANRTFQNWIFDIEFIQNYRVPLNLELEKLSYKSSLTIDDSVYILTYFIENPVDSQYAGSIQIKQAADQWLGAENMINDPSTASIDSIFSKFIFNDVYLDWVYKLSSKRKDTTTIDKICKMAISQLHPLLEQDAIYCQYSPQSFDYCYKILHRFIDWKNENLLTPATTMQLQTVIDYIESLRPH